MNVLKRSLKQFKRIFFDIFLLGSIMAVMYFSPYQEAKVFLMNVFITKLFVVSAGILHAHITRELIFPYIHFSTEKEWSNNLLIIAWYVTIISAWARGG